MPHRTFTAGDTDYITRMNALASSLDRRLAQNILINGSMHVWQRGTSFAGAATRVCGPDRWSFYRGSGATGMTASRQTGSDPSRYCTRVQRDNGNASTATITFCQALTTENTYPLRGKRLGVRFRARAGVEFSSASSILTVAFATGTGTDQHPATPYTGAATQASGTKTLTTSWQYFTLDLGTVGGTVTESALSFEFTPVGTASTSDYFELQEVQLVATTDSNVDVGDYPWQPFEEELAACLPYYEKSFEYGTTPAQNCGSYLGAAFIEQAVGAAVSGNGYVTYKRQKRAAVTPTLYNPVAANAQIRNYVRSADWSSSTVANAATSGFQLTGTTAAGSAAGDTSYVHWTADAEI